MESKIKYIKEAEVAEITGLALPTLRNQRCQGRGIPYCKIGSAIRYLHDDVVEYFKKRRIVPEK